MAAPVPRGMLRLRMAVQVPIRTKTAPGQRSESWLTVGHTWVHIERPQTVENSYEGGVTTRSDWRALCAWHPRIDVNARLVWLDKGTERTFNIREAQDRDQRRRDMELALVEVTP